MVKWWAGHGPAMKEKCRGGEDEQGYVDTDGAAGAGLGRRGPGAFLNFSGGLGPGRPVQIRGQGLVQFLGQGPDMGFLNDLLVGAGNGYCPSPRSSPAGLVLSNWVWA